MSTGSSNIVAAINRTSTVSMPSSALSATESIATVTVTTPITSTSNANTMDLSKSANESTANISIELNVNALDDTNSETEALHNNNNNSSGNSNSNTSTSTSTTIITTTNNNNSNNNIQPAHFYGNGSIRIGVPKMEESDSETELAQIESTATASSNVAVSMRTSATNNKNTPRPMSWEGELSENEDQMETDASNGLARATSTDNNVISYAFNGNMAKSMEQHAQTDNKNAMSAQYATNDIKPEFTDYTANSTSDGNTSNTFHVNKRYPLDMSNVKFEATLQPATNQYGQQSDINSPLLIRSKTNNLLPANPSPDSAIHSVYTHSSPSQSPLTSRHTPYTPSLSRNNSDASYSSCYSYSSEFSPTHSPIQGRHNMYNNSNFNGSPLHHSVLFKPMIDNNDNAKPAQHVTVNEDPALETEIIPSAGISRQQLINR